MFLHDHVSPGIVWSYILEPVNLMCLFVILIGTIFWNSKVPYKFLDNLDLSGSSK